MPSRNLATRLSWFWTFSWLVDIKASSVTWLYQWFGEQFLQGLVCPFFLGTSAMFCSLVTAFITRSTPLHRLAIVAFIALTDAYPPPDSTSHSHLTSNHVQTFMNRSVHRTGAYTEQDRTQNRCVHLFRQNHKVKLQQTTWQNQSNQQLAGNWMHRNHQFISFTRKWDPRGQTDFRMPNNRFRDAK